MLRCWCLKEMVLPLLTLNSHRGKYLVVRVKGDSYDIIDGVEKRIVYGKSYGFNESHDWIRLIM